MMCGLLLGGQEPRKYLFACTTRQTLNWPPVRRRASHRAFSFGQPFFERTTSNPVRNDRYQTDHCGYQVTWQLGRGAAPNTQPRVRKAPITEWSEAFLSRPHTDRRLLSRREVSMHLSSLDPPASVL
jgi:hypothetical protein